MQDLDKYISDIVDMAVAYAPKLAGAIITLIIGLWVIKVIVNSTAKIMEKRDLNPSLRPFLRSLLKFMLQALLIVTVISMVGVQMTSFVAILGAAGLAVGLALQGSLSNFAGGVMILIFKPFKVGDYIEGGGHAGSVFEIQIFHTHLRTPDNVRIIIPNGALSNSSIKNYSAETTRRVDWTFGIAYGDDVNKAYGVIKNIITSDERIKAEPEPFLAVSELADSSVNIVTRVWVDSPDYWGVKFDVQKKVYEEFPSNGLNIPFPQMDVHVHNN